MVSLRQILAAIVLSVLTAVSYAHPVMAQQSSSTNYNVSEVNFGSGGELRACSGSYCSKQSAGELTVGNTGSANYQAEGGFNTNRDPLLEVSNDGIPMDLGILDTGETKFGSTTFSIRTYLASGYEVYIDGTSPRNNTNNHVIAPMATAAVAQTGVEQFGINLRANTTPAVGNDAQQLPDATFSYGGPRSGYAATNHFKYVAGESIAYSASSSGQTIYTLSAIMNVGTTTPGGKYGGRLFLNVVPTF